MSNKLLRALEDESVFFDHTILLNHFISNILDQQSYESIRLRVRKQLRIKLLPFRKAELCSTIIRRSYKQRIQGITSLGEINKVFDVLTKIELFLMKGIPFNTTAAYLQKHPMVASAMTWHIKVLKHTSNKRFTPIQESYEEYKLGIILAEQYGLMPSKAIILAILRAYGIKRLVTTDDDYWSIPDTIIYQP